MLRLRSRWASASETQLYIPESRQYGGGDTLQPLLMQHTWFSPSYLWSLPSAFLQVQECLNLLLLIFNKKGTIFLPPLIVAPRPLVLLWGIAFRSWQTRKTNHIHRFRSDGAPPQRYPCSVRGCPKAELAPVNCPSCKVSRQAFKVQCAQRGTLWHLFF